jgi:hypothetical protein
VQFENTPQLMGRIIRGWSRCYHFSLFETHRIRATGLTRRGSLLFTVIHNYNRSADGSTRSRGDSKGASRV